MTTKTKKTPPAAAATKAGWMTLVFGLYLALVCLISGLTTTISFAGLMNSTITYNFPEISVNWHQIDRPTYDKRTKRDIQPTALEKETRRLEAKNRNKINALRDALDAATYFLIGLIIFLFHWRLFKQERNA